MNLQTFLLGEQLKRSLILSCLCLDLDSYLIKQDWGAQLRFFASFSHERL